VPTTNHLPIRRLFSNHTNADARLDVPFSPLAWVDLRDPVTMVSEWCTPVVLDDLFGSLDMPQFSPH
jgi:hypothetical protein